MGWVDKEVGRPMQGRMWYAARVKRSPAYRDCPVLISSTLMLNCRAQARTSDDLPLPVGPCHTEGHSIQNFNT
jgi:hypothetical protein